MNTKILVSTLIVIAVTVTGYLYYESSKKTTEFVGDVNITHSLGETQLSINPSTVVTFDYGILDTLDALGIEVAGLPKSSLPASLSKYQDAKYMDLGSLFEPDFESIYALKPDVIFISGRQSDLYVDFSEIAPTIFVGLDTTDFLNAFKGNLSMLEKIFPAVSAISEEIISIEARVEALYAKASNHDSHALVLMVNNASISTFGLNSRFGYIFDTFGVTPTDTTIVPSNHGQTVSFEYISEQNPQILFVIDRGTIVEGNSSAETLLDNALVNQTDAKKHNNVYYLNAEAWYLTVGGLNAMNTMIADIEQAYLG